MNGDYILWFIPIIWILFLLVQFYRAENKRQWLKTSWGIAATVTVFILSMGLVGLVSMLAE